MSTTNTKQESRREAAERIARKMFVNGAGQTADRLVLVQESRPGAAKIANAKDLGGWSVWPLADFIEAAFKERDERAERIAKTIPDSKFDLDHEPAPTEQQIRNAIAAAIRNGDTNA